jgi:hypothetical protein
MILSGYGSESYIFCKPDARVASDGPVTTSTSKSGQAMRVSLLQNTYPCPVRQDENWWTLRSEWSRLISPMQKFSVMLRL